MSIAKGCGNCIRDAPSADCRSPMERKTVQMGLVCSLLFHFSLLHLFFVVHGENSTDTPITLISRDLYHSSDSIIKEIKALVDRHPDRLTMETMRNGASDYFADILIVTYNRGKDDFDGSEFRILLSFGQHGRELITSEVALRLLAVLSEEHKMQKTEFDYLKNLPKRLIVKMVPMENLNGRKLVEAGDLCDRRNGRGVDLNRNWSVDWGKKEEDYDPYEENPGTAPFSEPETQIIRSLAKSFNPHVWVNVHSGMEALFMPYDHKNSTPAGVALEVMKSMLEELNQFHCKERCLIGSGGGSVGYLAHGTATDYMYDVVKVPMAFTFEIYGDLTASSKDCFKMFNPIDSVTFERVLDVWCSSFLRIFVMGPSQLGRIRKSLSTSEDRWVSIDTYLDGKLMSRNKQISTSDVLDFGIQELRTYFRLFLLSSILLIFMFCSRISRNKYRYMMPNMMTL